MSNTGENIYERRDGRWEGRYICGRKPDGRAQYVSVYGRSCSDVRNKIRERLRACTPEPAPRSTGASVLTVNQLFESFLSHADVKPSTYARYKTVIDLHILPKLGKRRVAGLTAKELSGYLAEKRKCGNLRTGGPLSEKSVRDLAVLLKSALRFAQKEFHIYTDALNMPLPSCKQKRVRVFSDQEVQLMARKIQDVSNQKNTGILLALCAGMRIGEICALKVSDIDLFSRYDRHFTRRAAGSGGQENGTAGANAEKRRFGARDPAHIGLALLSENRSPWIAGARVYSDRPDR